MIKFPPVEIKPKFKIPAKTANPRGVFQSNPVQPCRIPSTFSSVLQGRARNAAAQNLSVAAAHQAAPRANPPKQLGKEVKQQKDVVGIPSQQSIAWRSRPACWRNTPRGREKPSQAGRGHRQIRHGAASPTGTPGPGPTAAPPERAGVTRGRPGAALPPAAFCCAPGPPVSEARRQGSRPAVTPAASRLRPPGKAGRRSRTRQGNDFRLYNTA